MFTSVELDELFQALPRLETPRLLLEPVVMAHAEALFAVLSDAAVAQASNEAAHATLEATMAHVSHTLKQRDARTGISWALVLQAEGSVVGQLSVHSISWANRRGDLGFHLASRCWRQGLMSEALGAVIEWCFGRLRFIKLCAQNTVDNAACHHLLESLGFRAEALLWQHGYWNGKAHDLRQYGLLAPQRIAR